jgi:hypothetical protein
MSKPVILGALSLLLALSTETISAVQAGAEGALVAKACHEASRT